MPGPPSFDPTNWYWAVGGSTTQVYSSASGDYVPVTDPTYVAWKAGQGHSTNAIPTEAALGKQLATYLQRPTAGGVLDGYQDALAGGIITQAIFKLLFKHENDIRAIKRQLNGTNLPSDVSPATAKAFVKAIM